MESETVARRAATASRKAERVLANEVMTSPGNL
jgi:hypothetical protein